jgi:hypothetical protein
LQILSLFVYTAAPKKNAAVFGLVLVPAFVIAVPFVVAWIRLTVNGAGAVSHRRMFAFARVERRFLLGAFIVGFAPMLLAIFMIWLAILAASALGISFRPNSIGVTLFAAVVGVAALITVFVLYARLSLILVALALQRYENVRASWKQSKGMAWRLWAIMILASIPFYIGQLIIGGIQALVYKSVWVAPLAVIYEEFAYLGTAASVAGLSLVYKASKPAVKAPAGTKPLVAVDSASPAAGGAGSSLGGAIIR